MRARACDDDEIQEREHARRIDVGRSAMFEHKRKPQERGSAEELLRAGKLQHRNRSGNGTCLRKAPGIADLRNDDGERRRDRGASGNTADAGNESNAERSKCKTTDSERVEPTPFRYNRNANREERRGGGKDGCETRRQHALSTVEGRERAGRHAQPDCRNTAHIRRNERPQNAAKAAKRKHDRARKREAHARGQQRWPAVCYPDLDCAERRSENNAEQGKRRSDPCHKARRYVTVQNSFMPAQYHISGATARTIAESVEGAIDAGRFAGDAPLPTIRELAASLGVSPTTVNAAFALLRRRGRIVGRRRGGSIVVPRVAFQSGADNAVPAVGRDFAVANPDPAFLPLLRAALTKTLGERRLYTDIRDSDALERLAKRDFEASGVPAAHYGVASGAMDAIERALLVTVTAGDVIALEDPTYPPYVELARALELRVVRMRVDERGIIATDVRQAVHAGAKALITIPRAHNPTGASLDKSRVREVLRSLAGAPDLLIIEDDYLAAVCGVPLATLVRNRKRFMHVRSLAKILGPDLRVATFVGDALTVARMRDRQRIGAGWVSVVLQDTAAALLGDTATQRRIATATQAYAERRALFVAALARTGLRGTAGAGFTVWVPVRDEAAAVGAAQAAGFAIDGGGRYRAAAPAGVRVTTTTMRAREASALANALVGAGRHGP